MGIIKIPQSSVDFFKKHQDEIFRSGNLSEGPWNEKLADKVKKISGTNFLTYWKKIDEPPYIKEQYDKTNPFYMLKKLQ